MVCGGHYHSTEQTPLHAVVSRHVVSHVLILLHENQGWKRRVSVSDTVHWPLKLCIHAQSNAFSKFVYFVFVIRYTINDRNLGRLLNQITTTYNTDLMLWKVSIHLFCFFCLFVRTILDILHFFCWAEEQVAVNFSGTVPMIFIFFNEWMNK